MVRNGTGSEHLCAYETVVMKTEDWTFSYQHFRTFNPPFLLLSLWTESMERIEQKQKQKKQKQPEEEPLRIYDLWKKNV